MICGSIANRFRRLLSSLKGPERLCLPADLLFILPRGLSLLVKWPGAYLTIQLPLVQSVKLNGGVTPLLHMPSWRAEGHIYFHLFAWKIPEIYSMSLQNNGKIVSDYLALHSGSRCRLP